MHRDWTSIAIVIGALMFMALVLGGVNTLSQGATGFERITLAADNISKGRLLAVLGGKGIEVEEVGTNAKIAMVHIRTDCTDDQTLQWNADAANWLCADAAAGGGGSGITLPPVGKRKEQQFYTSEGYFLPFIDQAVERSFASFQALSFPSSNSRRPVWNYPFGANPTLTGVGAHSFLTAPSTRASHVNPKGCFEPDNIPRHNEVLTWNANEYNCNTKLGVAVWDTLIPTAYARGQVLISGGSPSYRPKWVDPRGTRVTDNLYLRITRTGSVSWAYTPRGVPYISSAKDYQLLSAKTQGNRNYERGTWIPASQPKQDTPSLLSYSGRGFDASNGNWSWVEPDWGPQTIEVTLTASDIRALGTTPKKIFTSPNAPGQGDKINVALDSITVTSRFVTIVAKSNMAVAEDLRMLFVTGGSAPTGLWDDSETTTQQIVAQDFLSNTEAHGAWLINPTSAHRISNTWNLMLDKGEAGTTVMIGDRDTITVDQAGDIYIVGWALAGADLDTPTTQTAAQRWAAETTDGKLGSHSTIEITIRYWIPRTN